jgi:D-sedoheptulose 7-phosphate isomerase
MSTSTGSRRVTSVRVRTTRSGSEDYFQSHFEVLEQLPHSDIEAVAEALWLAYQQDRALFVFGNGGSAALASHSACDFGKGTIVNGDRRFRVISLTDNVPLMTAWANDQRYEDVFAEQLRSYVRPGDVVLAISGSGNSPNILNGLRVARDTGALTIGLTGFQGGKMKLLCDLCIIVPSESMQVIEDFHLSVTHSIFVSLRKRIAEAGEGAS